MTDAWFSRRLFKVLLYSFFALGTVVLAGSLSPGRLVRERPEDPVAPVVRSMRTFFESEAAELPFRVISTADFSSQVPSRSLSVKYSLSSSEAARASIPQGIARTNAASKTRTCLKCFIFITSGFMFSLLDGPQQLYYNLSGLTSCAHRSISAQTLSSRQKPPA